MKRSEADHLVFYRDTNHGQCIYLVVYVNDIAITGDVHEGIELSLRGMLNCKPLDTYGS